MAVSMRFIEGHLDLSEPDPPIRGFESIRVSHLVAHPTNPEAPRLQQVAHDFGIPKDAVFAAISYYLRNRSEIELAIENRNTAYQDELGNA